MNLHSKRSIVWTVVLVLFMALEIYSRFPWLSLVIPGTILMWYGLLAEPQGEIAVRNRTRSGLN